MWCEQYWFGFSRFRPCEASLCTACVHFDFNLWCIVIGCRLLGCFCMNSRWLFGLRFSCCGTNAPRILPLHCATWLLAHVWGVHNCFCQILLWKIFLIINSVHYYHRWAFVRRFYDNIFVFHFTFENLAFIDINVWPEAVLECGLCVI